jgi:hypothetical protein
LEGSGPHLWSERQPMVCGLAKGNALQVTLAENNLDDLTIATFEAARHVTYPSIGLRECRDECSPENGGQTCGT